METGSPYSAAQGLFNSSALVNMNDLQNLLYDTLVTTGNVECCAILRKTDGFVKASSPG